MAKIQEEVVVITVSKLVKNEGSGTEVVTDDIVAALASVAEELLGNGVVVEVSKA
jgi:phosphatidylglycerophosphatase A